MTGRIILCGDNSPVRDPNPDCPRSELHTPCPSGYNDWFAWAGSMIGKHSQSRCPGCRLYNVWTARVVVSTTSGLADD